MFQKLHRFLFGLFQINIFRFRHPVSLFRGTSVLVSENADYSLPYKVLSEKSFIVLLCFFFRMQSMLLP